MANVIQIKRKTTSGAPSVGSINVGEMCWVDPDNAMYIKKIDSTIVQLNPDGGSGLTISFFQVKDNGSSTYLTTGAATVLSNIWDVPEITGSDFNFTNGVLLINEPGTIELDILVHSWNNANNRHELHVILDKNNSEVTEASAYTSRNNTQDEGSVIIPGFKSQVEAGDTFRLRVFDVGVAATIGGSNIPNQTYISAKLYK